MHTDYFATCVTTVSGISKVPCSSNQPKRNLPALRFQTGYCPWFNSTQHINVKRPGCQLCKLQGYDYREAQPDCCNREIGGNLGSQVQFRLHSQAPQALSISRAPSIDAPSCRKLPALRAGPRNDKVILDALPHRPPAVNRDIKDAVGKGNSHLGDGAATTKWLGEAAWRRHSWLCAWEEGSRCVCSIAHRRPETSEDGQSWRLDIDEH